MGTLIAFDVRKTLYHSSAPESALAHFRLLLARIHTIGFGGLRDDLRCNHYAYRVRSQRLCSPCVILKTLNPVSLGLPMRLVLCSLLMSIPSKGMLQDFENLECSMLIFYMLDMCSFDIPHSLSHLTCRFMFCSKEPHSRALAQCVLIVHYALPFAFTTHFVNLNYIPPTQSNTCP